MRAAAPALILVGAGLGPAAAATPPAADDQLWSEIDVVAPAGPVRITALGVVRTGAGQPDPTLAGGGVIADVPVGAGVTVSGGDLWVRVHAAGGRGVDVQLPLAAVSYAWRWGAFGFSDRNRAEQLIGVPGDPWRYRNRLSVERAVSVGPLRTVFASNEVFYDLGAGRWSRNRAQIGVGLKPVGPAALDLFLMRQDDRAHRPSRLNILGFELRITP